MRRSAAARIATAFLLLLFVGAQPAMLCAVDCLLQRHGVTHQAHPGHHGSSQDQPCHTGQVNAGSTVPVMSLATAVASLPVAVDVATGPDAAVAVPRPVTTLRSITLPQDTPPPRA